MAAPAPAIPRHMAPHLGLARQSSSQQVSPSKRLMGTADLKAWPGMGSWNSKKPPKSATGKGRPAAKPAAIGRPQLTVPKRQLSSNKSRRMDVGDAGSGPVKPRKNGKGKVSSSPFRGDNSGKKRGSLSPTELLSRRPGKPRAPVLSKLIFPSKSSSGCRRSQRVRSQRLDILNGDKLVYHSKYQGIAAVLSTQKKKSISGSQSRKARRRAVGKVTVLSDKGKDASSQCKCFSLQEHQRYVKANGIKRCTMFRNKSIVASEILLPHWGSHISSADVKTSLFRVTKGHVCATVNTTSCELKVGDAFLAPAGNHWKVENIQATSSKLFCSAV